VKEVVLEYLRTESAMNIDLHGKQVLIGGADGTLTSAVRQALADNGATIAGIYVAAPVALSTASVADPFALILVSKGAEGIPETDMDHASERTYFLRSIRHFAPRLKRVVLLFSAAGLVPIKGLAQFCADQAGIATLTRAMAMELGPSCAVNAVSVGAYQTADDDIRTSRFLTHTALRRPASLDEIFSAVLFLADPHNTYMTGHTLNIDGGWAAGYARNF